VNHQNINKLRHKYMLVACIAYNYSNVVVNLHVGLDVSASVWGFFAFRVHLALPQTWQPCT